MYMPSDIKRPSEFEQDVLTHPNHLYTGFGKCEDELIIQRILLESQEEGNWVSLPAESFAHLFKTLGYAQFRLEDMVERTPHLEREGEEYSLTQRAIERLVEKYPVVQN